MPTALGVDLSTRSCGVAIVGDDTVLVSRQVNVPPKLDKWGRLQYVGDVFSRFLSYGPPDVVVFENVRLFHGGKISISAIRDLARLQGVISFLSSRQNVCVIEVPVQHWRRVVLGDGRAKKSDVVAWAKDFSGRDDLGVDEAEAIALARFGIIYTEQQQRKRSIRRSMEVDSDGARKRRRPRPVDSGGNKRQGRR